MSAFVRISGILVGLANAIAYYSIGSSERLLGGYGVAMTPSAVLYGASLGGVLGLTEGRVLAFPLAALLGLFGERQTTSP